MELLRGYKYPSAAFTEHFIAFAPREEKKSPGTIIFLMPARLMNS